MYRYFALAVLLMSAVVPAHAQKQSKPEAIALGRRTAAQLRGSVTVERRWWDLKHYQLAVEVDPENKRIVGVNQIRFRVLESGRKMQVDLQLPLTIDAVTWGDVELPFNRQGNVFWIDFPVGLPVGSIQTVGIGYSGVPLEAANPPWSGGVVWKKDGQGKHLIATACQGTGASVWWPCKDHGSDEPDEGMDILITVPEGLKGISNGRLVEETHLADDRKRTFHWRVKNPINNYAVTMNVGDYVHLADRYEGEFGGLDVDYWVLRGQGARAQAHFKEVPRTLAAFEHWFGKYPFYEDSFKLVVVPFLGMEHQSAVSYGNNFGQGYNGRDLSKTGVGLLFDFIIVHESGHEWFGNSVTSQDIADMWIHESFTNYAETLFVDYHFTSKEANDYVIGCRELIKNDRPIIGAYGLHERGSGTDMYYKGANMLHTIRQIVDDDEKWRRILRGINEKFFHQTVTTEQIENYISVSAGVRLQELFDQYLRSTEIPKLTLQRQGRKLSFKFENCNQNLSFPVKLDVNGGTVWIKPTTAESVIEFQQPIETLSVDRNFFLLWSVSAD